ncbi:carboxypeptidase S [Tilletiaria anomala UBC 951]|uniref:Carboxypeptidase S n=1 Tax=Tilletiaria anomala (strain ATCC 24038 / CBS 436.72 / UBC 951) TaxID=1037660 RepID=A0A066VN58_TILAU|nr:carboxypeptidase S [Tilletiaria anomala UBC 951]KDN40015.1 carboxypeptidase S [Tilletiaria anomala UBC 951]
MRGLLVAFILIASLLHFWQPREPQPTHRSSHRRPSHGSRKLCPQHPPFQHRVAAPGNLKQPSRQELAHRLSGAVQVDTSVSDEWPHVKDDPERWARVFSPFRAYLERTFPTIHAPGSKVSRTLVNEHGLLFEWPGADPSLKPLLLMAHQDAVPVEPTTIDQWTHPPFSGYYDEQNGLIWGRGAADTKSTIISILSSVQSLLESDFTPNRTLVVSFGFDEEAAGTEGALALSTFLEHKYGPNSMAMIVDEGGSVTPADTKTGSPAVAGPAVREKGYLDVSIKVKTPGGHSSVPTPHTSIGMLSAVIVAMEKQPHKPVLRTDSPAWNQLLCAADAGNTSPKLTRAIHVILDAQDELDALSATPRNGGGCPQKAMHRVTALQTRLKNAKKRVLKLMDPIERVAFQTTQAVDLIKGGVKINALPEEATAVVNSRIEPGTPVQEIRERTARIVAPVARQMGLNLDAWGQERLSFRLDPTKAKGTIVLSDAFGSGLEPSPATPLNGEEAKPWRLLSGVIRATWDASDADASQSTSDGITVVPTLMVGNTDTSRYWRLTRHIFRFSAGTLKLEPEGTGAKTPFGGIHTVDEREQDDALAQGWRFYSALIRAASEVEL